MIDIGSFSLLSVAMFIGAFVSGLAGFAFSAAAGAILLHVLRPIEAVPLMMICSLGVQAISLWALRKNVRWRESLGLVSGGLLGVPIGVWLLRNADATVFREAFGLVVAVYAAYILFRPTLSYRPMRQGRNAIVGFGGGLIGALTAMPGALPTAWCCIHGVPRDQQRGLVQPFIVTMQIFALLIMLARDDLSSKVVVDVALSVPALLAGSAVGILAFRNVNESVFRRIIFGILFLSGVLLIG
jgi:uncharacterized protein